MHQDCNIHAHACVSDESKVAQLPYFQGLTCFEIAHHPRCKGLFTKIERKGKNYSRTVPSHSIVQEVKELYQSTMPRRSVRDRFTRSRAGRPPTTIVTRNEETNNEIESMTKVTGIETTPESLSLTNTPTQDQEQPKRKLCRRKQKQPPVTRRRTTTRSTRYSTRVSTRAPSERAKRQIRKKR